MHVFRMLRLLLGLANHNRKGQRILGDYRGPLTPSKLGLQVALGQLSSNRRQVEEEEYTSLKASLSSNLRK